MDQLFKERLLNLGFEQKLETLFSIEVENKLYTTSNKWLIFAYFEDGKYYFSNNGDLVSSFDTPDIDIVSMLEDIKYEIDKFGCYLSGSKIVKEIDLNNFDKDLDNFVSAVYKVDKMYEEL